MVIIKSVRKIFETSWMKSYRVKMPENELREWFWSILTNEIYSSLYHFEIACIRNLLFCITESPFFSHSRERLEIKVGLQKEIFFKKWNEIIFYDIVAVLNFLMEVVEHAVQCGYMKNSFFKCNPIIIISCWIVKENSDEFIIEISFFCIKTDF